MARNPKKRISVSERMTALAEGRLSPEDLDDEEIARCQLRNKNGQFSSRPSHYIPRVLMDKFLAENAARMSRRFQSDAEPARAVLRAIMLNRRAPADARYKAATYLMERAIGKIPDKSETIVHVAKWEENIEDIFYEEDEEDTELDLTNEDTED